MKKNNHKNNAQHQLLDTDLELQKALINKKLPSWATFEGLVFPNRLALEQCSGENTALYKEAIVTRLFPDEGETMADLTGGLGVDFSFVSKHFKRKFYIERQKALCDAAHVNFPKLGIKDATIIEGNGVDELLKLPQLDLLFLDPARRDNIGRKTVFIEDCEPNVIKILPEIWEKTSCVILKLSPMLDLTRAIHSLRTVSEAHIVADNGECKELLLVLHPKVENTTIYCKDKDKLFIFKQDEESNAKVSYTSEPKQYLYEPCSAILKAGAFKLISERYQLEKLHPNSHLYTSDKHVNKFPGRSFKINQMSSFSKSDIKKLLQTKEKANLTIRNFPGSVAELRKRLKLKEGGDAYWFATTLANEKHVILDCEKV